MAFYDLSHTYHKQVTKVSPACFCHPSVGNFDVSPNKGFSVLKTAVVYRCGGSNIDVDKGCFIPIYSTYIE